MDKKSEPKAAAQPAQPAEPKKADTNPLQALGTQINVNFGGNQAPTPQQPVQQAANNRAWYCTTKAFMDEFEAFGPTQLEANRATLEACKAKNHEMHCRDIHCKQNL